MSVRTIAFKTHSTPRYVTPSSPSLKGSTPPIEIVSVGDRRLPARRRSKVVFPAPFAIQEISPSSKYKGDKKI